MTARREAVRRWFRPRNPEASNAAGYSYAVHWTRTARTWDGAKRERARITLLDLTRRAEFVPTVYERRYTVTEVDDSAHAGASLVALLRVLEALAAPEGDPAQEKT
jgi:hypothetical protein